MKKAINARIKTASGAPQVIDLMDALKTSLAANAPVERLVSIHRRPKTDVRSATDRLPSRLLALPSKDKPLIVSVSEVKDFLRCRVRWNLRHQARLEPSSGSENLSIGSLVHQINEQWYALASKKRTVKAMASAAQAAISATTLKALDSDARQLVEAMTVGYASWALNPNNERSDAQLGLGECFPEEWFEIPLVNDGSILLRGKYDNRFEPRTMKHTLAIVEVKTAKQIRMSRFDYNTQVMGYAAGMRYQPKKKYKRFVIFPTVLRKQLPGPRVRADLFARDMIEPTDDDVQLWMRDTARVALDMYDAAIYPNPTENCEWDCDFRNPCLLRATPGDLKYVLKTEYQPKERT